MAQRIGFTLGGDEIPVRDFLEASRRWISLLKAIEAEMFRGKSELEWAIHDLGTGSATHGMSPVSGADAANAAAVIRATLDGIRVLESAGPRPIGFSDDALLEAKQFVSVINGHVNRVTVFGNPAAGDVTVRHSATLRTAVRVDELIGVASTVLGAIEGRLETINLHGGRCEFGIYESVDGKRLRCLCDRSLIDEIKNHLGRRLRVSGVISLNASRRPTSIRVESHKLLREQDELPQAKDLRGLLADNPIDYDALDKYLDEGD